MEHEKTLSGRDRAVVEINTQVVTRMLLGAYPRLEVLVLLSSVEGVERDALLDLPALEAVVVDTESKCSPEECDYGMEGDRYRHVAVFRIDTAHPPLVSLPDTLFLAGYPIPILLHSGAPGVAVGVSDGRVLASTRRGYEVQTLRFPQGKHAIGDAVVSVVEWGTRRDCGVPDEVGEGGIELRVPYGVYEVGERQYGLNRRLKSAHLPPTVKTIGEGAFQYCANLAKVTLTAVSEIGAAAFHRCGLTEVTIPGSVEKISGWAFDGCKSLTSVEMREGVQSLGDHAFCFSPLTSAHIPSSAKYIGRNPFYNIPSLTSSSPRFRAGNDELVDVKEGRLITRIGRGKEHRVPEGVRVIGEHAFYECKELESVTLSSTVEEIRSNAFSSTGLTRIVIPGGVKRIGNMAFYMCESLETVELSEGLEAIGDSAFQWTALRTLTIPSTVVSISRNPFNGCRHLALRSDNERFVVTERGELVDMEEARLITYPCSNETEEHVVSERVRTIGEWAAANNRHFKAVRLHTGVKDIGEGAFCGCTQLTTFTIPEGVRRLSGKGIFTNTMSLTSLEIPHSLWSSSGIGSQTFMGSSISNVCYVIHSEDEKGRLQSKAVGGRLMETVTFKLGGSKH